MNWSGKEQSPYCSTCVAVADFSSRTEMLPVEPGVVDWERDAILAPLYSLASIYKHAKARPGSPVRISQILSNQDRSSTSLTIFSLNLAENYQPVNELYQTADHPALSPERRDPEWRVATAYKFGGFWFTTWKTRQKYSPFDLTFSTAIVFWWFLQTYMTSGPCSSWFFLVVKRCIFDGS